MASVRFHKNDRGMRDCMDLIVLKPAKSQQLVYERYEGNNSKPVDAKYWAARLRKEGKRADNDPKKLWIHSVHTKTGKVETEDNSPELNSSEDEAAPATPAETVGLDWIEDDATRKSEKSKFEIDNVRFLRIASRYVGFPVNVWSTEDAKRIPHFSEIAWAYQLRTRYASGDPLTDSEHRYLRNVVNRLTAFDKGLCPSNTCPNNECANPNLSLNQRNAFHLLNQNAEEKRKRVGQCFCVVFLGGQYRLGIFTGRAFYKDADVFRMLCAESEGTRVYITAGLLIALPGWRVIEFLINHCRWTVADANQAVGRKVDAKGKISTDDWRIFPRSVVFPPFAEKYLEFLERV